MNKNHDQQGRFSSGSDAGAATGDHAAVSPRLDVRNVSGRAVPRSKPITRHAGVPSVGTDKPRFIAVAGGLKPAVPTRGLRSAARERVAMLKEIDERHFPTPTDASVASKTDFGKPSLPSKGAGRVFRH